MVQVARLQVGRGSLIQDLIQGSGTKRNGRNGESGLERSTQIRLREEKQWRVGVALDENANEGAKCCVLSNADDPEFCGWWLCRAVLQVEMKQ